MRFAPSVSGEAFSIFAMSAGVVMGREHFPNFILNGRIVNAGRAVRLDQPALGARCPAIIIVVDREPTVQFARRHIAGDLTTAWPRIEIAQVFGRVCRTDHPLLQRRRQLGSCKFVRLRGDPAGAQHDLDVGVWRKQFV